MSYKITITLPSGRIATKQVSVNQAIAIALVMVDDEAVIEAGEVAPSIVAPAEKILRTASKRAIKKQEAASPKEESILGVPKPCCGSKQHRHKKSCPEFGSDPKPKKGSTQDIRNALMDENKGGPVGDKAIDEIAEKFGTSAQVVRTIRVSMKHEGLID